MPRIDLGSGPDFGKALRIALCQRGVQNQLKGLHTFVVLLAGMPGSITGSWLVMVLSCWSTVGENVSQGGSGITNSGPTSSNSPIDSHLPASAGCNTSCDPILHAVHWFMSSFIDSVSWTECRIHSSWPMVPMWLGLLCMLLHPSWMAQVPAASAAVTVCTS